MTEREIGWLLSYGAESLAAMYKEEYFARECKACKMYKICDNINKRACGDEKKFFKATSYRTFVRRLNAQEPPKRG